MLFSVFLFMRGTVDIGGAFITNSRSLTNSTNLPADHVSPDQDQRDCLATSVPGLVVPAQNDVEASAGGRQKRTALVRDLSRPCDGNTRMRSTRLCSVPWFRGGFVLCVGAEAPPEKQTLPIEVRVVVARQEALFPCH